MEHPLNDYQEVSQTVKATSLVKESQDYERGGTQKDEYSPSEVVEVPCPLCGSRDANQLYKEHCSIGISKCASCSLIYTSPRLISPEEVYWGDVKKYYSEARLIFEGKASHHRDSNYLEELNLIRRYKSRGRFLDVGCNMGMLLRLAKQMGWDAVGVEPSAALWELATRHNGLTAYNCFLHELPEAEERSFDIVALSDVFEHICDPLAFLHDAGRFLSDGGILYIKVPNGRWNLFKQEMLGLMGRKPSQGIWDSYEHVVHYTDVTLKQMLDKAGFDVLKITIGRPVQTPVWHQYVGHYYQYPTPVRLDWKRHLGRSTFYLLSWPERLLRLGSIGAFAPNIVAVAKKRQTTS